jgi:hypothetical protein
MPAGKRKAAKRGAGTSDSPEPTAKRQSDAGASLEPRVDQQWNAATCAHCRSKWTKWHFGRCFGQEAPSDAPPSPPKSVACQPCNFAAGTRFVAKFSEKRGRHAFDRASIAMLFYDKEGEVQRMQTLAPKKREEELRRDLQSDPEVQIVGVFETIDKANHAAFEYWWAKVRGAGRCACEGEDAALDKKRGEVTCKTTGKYKCPDPRFSEGDWGPVSVGIYPDSYVEQYIDGLITIQEDTFKFKTRSGEALAWVEVLGCGCGPAQQFERNWDKYHTREDQSEDEY